MRIVQPQKTCTLCHQRKPWSEFFAAVKWEDGTMRRPQSRCKLCNRRLSGEYQRRVRREQPERMRTKDRNAYARLKADPERMELWRARHRDYQAKRRRAAGMAERPRCSPYGRAAVLEESLPAPPFAAWVRSVLERDEASIMNVAGRFDMPDKKLREILNGRRDSVDLVTVERALIADDTCSLMDIYPDLYSEAA